MFVFSGYYPGLPGNSKFSSSLVSRAGEAGLDGDEDGDGEFVDEPDLDPDGERLFHDALGTRSPSKITSLVANLFLAFGVFNFSVISITNRSLGKTFRFGICSTVCSSFFDSNSLICEKTYFEISTKGQESNTSFGGIFEKYQKFPVSSGVPSRKTPS